MVLSIETSLYFLFSHMLIVLIDYLSNIQVKARRRHLVLIAKLKKGCLFPFVSFYCESVPL